MRFIDDQAKDAALNEIADNGDELHLLSQAPAIYADVATYSLGFVALLTGDGVGSYTVQDGLTSGRRLTVVAQTIPGTDDGIADHLAIVDTVNERIKTVDQAPNWNIQTGVNKDIPEFDACVIDDPIA